MNVLNVKADMEKKQVISSSHFDIRPFIIVFALIAIWGILEVVTSGTFLTPRNLSLLFRQMSTIAIIAVGMVLVIVAGYIDLSVGSIVAFCGAVSAIMQSKMGMNTIPSIIVPIIVGVIFTGWNGYWSAYRKVPPFIVTLSTMLIFRALTLIITNSQTISSMNPDFRFIGEGYISPAIGYIIGMLGITVYIFFELKGRRDRIVKGIPVQSHLRFVFKLAGIPAIILAFVIIMNLYEGIPIPVIILIATTLVIAFMAQKTRFGRRLYAIGGNPEAAKLSGINVRLEALKIYFVLGALSAMSGLILTARLDAATTNAGNSFEFSAISAAIIGGTSFMGGEGTVFGALIGSLIMASLSNGMSILNVPSSYQGILTGVVLLAAVWFDMAARNKGK